MTIKRYKYSTAAKALSLFAALSLWGCSADSFDAPDRNLGEEFKDAQIVLEVPIPRGEDLSVLDTRATQAAEGNELQINDLRLYVFPNVSTAASKKNEPLEVPTLTAGSSKKYGVSGLEKNGKYVVYLLANFGDAANNFANSAALEEYVATFDPQAATGAKQLEAGKLPMVFKSQEIELSSTEIGTKEVVAPLEYACVKVKYTIIFDKSDQTTKNNFGDKGMKPGAITLTNVGNKVGTMANTSTDYHEDSENTTKFESSKNHLSWNYYSNYSTTANSSSTGADKIAVNTAMNESSVETADKWVLQGVTYLPERHVSDAANMTTLTMDSKVGGSDVQHTLTLGSDTDKKNLKRGNYYEVIGRVKETGINGVDWKIEVQQWEEISIDADFVHTYLTLDHTSVEVTSVENGEIKYETDGRGNIGFESFMYEPENSKEKIPLFELASPVTEAEHKLVIRVNSDVTVDETKTLSWEDFKDEYPNGVPCYIVAGNIKKEIYVKYEIGPIFEFTPSTIKIQEGDGVSDDQHIFEYRSNLGGFNLESLSSSSFTFNQDSKSDAVEHTLGSTKISLQVIEGSSASRGKIQVKVKKYGETTVVHSFNATSPSGNTSIPLTVEVMPNRGSYRIYFRAINDYQAGDGDEFLHKSSDGLPKEDYGTGASSKNWIDYWYGTNRTSESAQSDSHRIYAYTQYGEAANTQPVWRYTTDFGISETEFTYTHPGTELWVNEDDYVLKDSKNNDWKSKNKMTPDNDNPGWYYYDIPKTCKGYYAIETAATKWGTDLYKKYGFGPLPGATLLIFYNDENGGDSRHRVNQENEPGIPLGDDNDMETWVLFDPSRDPVYTVYNDKPRIEDVEYVVYSDTDFKQWRNDYGKRNIHASLTSITPENEAKNKGYNYKYSLKFKAPRGEYDKSITLKSAAYSIVCIGLYEVDLNAWGTPYAVFNDGETGAIHEQWVLMTKIPGKDSEYYAIVPDKWIGQHVKFCSSVDTSKSPYKQHWRDNNPYSYDWSNYDIPESPATKMTWTNSGDNSWNVMGDDYVKIENPNDVTTTMYGGRSWRTGYFKKNSGWSQTPQ